MRVLVIDGSPNRNGNTSVLADEVVAGILEEGPHEVFRFRLNDMNIKPCQACYSCYGTGQCCIQDDMQALYAHFIQADAMVFAIPIYWWHMCAQAKLCFDRLTAHLTKDDKLSSFVGKPVILIVAFNHEESAKATISMFRDFRDWIDVKLTVIKHCARDGGVSDHPDKLEEAREAGRILAASYAGSGECESE